MQISGIFSKKILPNLNGGFLCILACMFCTPAPAMPGTVTLEKYGLTYLYTVNPTTCEQDYTYTCYTDDSYTLAVQHIDGDVSSFQGCVTLDFQGITYWENSNGKGYKLHGCRIAGFVHNPTPTTAPHCKAACSGGGTTPSGSQIYDGCWDANGGAARSRCYSSSCMGPATGTDTTCPQLCWGVGVCSGRYNYPGVDSNGNLSCQAGCVFTCPEGKYGKPWVRPSIVTGDATEWANTAAASMSCKQPNEAGWYLPPGNNYYLPDYRYTDCMSGWYQSGSTTRACAQCAAPKPGETNAGVVSDVGENNGITSCYIPGNTRFSDESGSGRYLQNCSYVQGN